ncbi:MAG: hypothetical protein ACJ72D_02590, partial [Marmoricola sp.]
AVFVVTVLVGAAIGTVVGSEGDGGSRTPVVSRLDVLAADTLSAAPKATPTRLTKPRGVGSRFAGLGLLALSEEDSVPTSRGDRRAPDGGTLITFRVGDWACEIKPCKDWKTLKPTVEVDGNAQDLPTGDDTFVLSLPPGTSDVRLVIDDQNYTQSIALLGDAVDDDQNIALLARKGAVKQVALNTTYQLAEHTSMPLTDASGAQVDQFVRTAVVDYAQLRFFLNGSTPSRPDRAFLVVNAYYSYAGGTGRYAFDPAEAVFVAKDGSRYRAKDLDPSPQGALLGFEVPADVRSGTFVVGGSTEKTSTTGITYTSDLQQLRQPVNLG